MDNKEYKKDDILILIPKSKQYIGYIIELIIKLPRVEKFSIGIEYKKIMYEMFENIMYISKLDYNSCLIYLNKIDVQLNIQREFLRIMYKNRWIDNKKFDVAMGLIYEQGKIIGGLLKYYGKMVKK